MAEGRRKEKKGRKRRGWEEENWVFCFKKGTIRIRKKKAEEMGMGSRRRRKEKPAVANPLPVAVLELENPKLYGDRRKDGWQHERNNKEKEMREGDEK